MPARPAPDSNLYPHTARPQVTAPPLLGAVTADVAIVGGGYTGLSTALHLARAGLRPVLVEAGAIGQGCSGRNGGQVNPGLKWLPDEVEAHWGPDLGPRMVAAAYGAPAEVFGLVEAQGIDCAPARTGTIRAAVDAAGVRQIDALTAQDARRGGAIHLAGPDEMRDRTGCPRYRAGAVDPRGGHLNPLAYARGLAVAAERAGAVLHEASAAVALRREGPDWCVETRGGRITAPEIVVATNGYTGDLWPGLKRTLAPVYTYITASDPLPPEVRAAVLPSGAALYELAWDAVYYRIDDAGRLIMGGRGPQRAARGAADYRHLADYARRLWPATRGIAWPWRWNGQVAMTQDHYPHLTAPEPGVHLMLGYNGRGIAMATIAGRMIAARIASQGRAVIDLPVRDRLEPMRFQPFWRLGAEAAMGWHRALDRLTGR